MRTETVLGIANNEELRFGIKKSLFCINTILFQSLLP